GAAAQFGGDADERWPAVLDLVQRDHGVLTSSVGRLFDAVAALVGVRQRVSYEGQAAIELEALAVGADSADVAHYEYELRRHQTLIVDPRPLVAGIMADRERNVPASAMAAGFHRALAAATIAAATELASRYGCDCVALSGGVFQNELLRRGIADGLRTNGLRVLQHGKVPTNDGGISIGQAAVAATLSDRLGTAPGW
ncbi:MAG: hypothetical protein JO087_04835, partial [Actinobacteria bacterium]|nr:hypothetical protein [Actinomycetota bacterium]